MTIPLEVRKQMMENFRACVHQLPNRQVPQEEWTNPIDTYDDFLKIAPKIREAIQRLAVMQQHLWNEMENNKAWIEAQVSKMKAMIEKLKP